MKTYIFSREIVNVETWSIDAESEEEAWQALQDGTDGVLDDTEHGQDGEFEFCYVVGEE